MSGEFPVTNDGLASAFSQASDSFMILRDQSKVADNAATIGDLLDAFSVSFGLLSESIRQANAGYPQTLCPIPTNPDMAAAMQLVGYEHLRLHAPERLQRDLIGIPAEVLKALLADHSRLIAISGRPSDDVAYRIRNQAMVFLNGFEDEKASQADL